MQCRRADQHEQPDELQSLGWLIANSSCNESTLSLKISRRCSALLCCLCLVPSRVVLCAYDSTALFSALLCASLLVLALCTSLLRLLFLLLPRCSSPARPHAQCSVLKRQTRSKAHERAKESVSARSERAAATSNNEESTTGATRIMISALP